MKQKLLFTFSMLLLLAAKLFAQTDYSYPTNAETFAGILTPNTNPTPNCNPVFTTTVPAIGTTSTHTLSTSGTWTVDGAYGQSANGNPTFSVRLNKSNVPAGTTNVNGSLITPRLNQGANSLFFDARIANTGAAASKTLSVFKIVNGVEDPVAIYSTSFVSSAGIGYYNLSTLVNIDYVGLGLTDLKLRIRNTTASAGSGNNDIFIDNVRISAYVPVPTITTTGALVQFNQSGANNPTAGQSYFVNGVNLTADADVTAPAGFEVSLDSTAWTGTLALAQSGGTLVGQPVKVYVRANAATAGIINGNVTNASTGAASINVPVSVKVTPAYYLKAGTTDASLAANFTNNPGGVGGADAPNFTDEALFFVTNNATANLSANVTLGPLAKFIVGNGATATTFNVATGVTLAGRLDVTSGSTAVIDGTIENNVPASNSGTIAGTLTVNGNHNLTANGAVVFSLSGSPAINYVPASTINVTGATTTVTVFQNYASGIPNIAVGNVVWNSAGQTANGSPLAASGNATLNVTGNFTVASTGATAHIFLGNGAGLRTINVTGNYIQNSGDVRIYASNPTNQNSNSGISFLNVTGNVNVNTGTLMVSGANGTGKGILNTKGNITNTGTITNTSTGINRGVIELSGTANQTISTSNDFATGGTGRVNMRLNTDAIADLSNSVTVDSLFINKGKLRLGVSDLTLGSENGVLDTAAAIGYVITNGTGGVIMPVSAQTNFFFPVGNLANAKPATITFSAAPASAGTLKGRFDDSYAGEDLTTPLNEPGVAFPIDRVNPGQWEINNTGVVFGTYTITATHNGTSGIVPGQLANTSFIKRPNAGVWSLEGTHITTTGTENSPILSRSGLTTFSQFALGAKSSFVLPIQILHFNGVKQANGNLLSWKIAASEKGTVELQRSTNGVDFENIYKQQINVTNTALTSNDSHIDINSIANINYYRIKITKEQTGAVVYSSIIVLKSFNKSGIQIEGIHPNPVNNNTVIQISTEKPGNVELITFDSQGKRVSFQNVSLGAGVTAIPFNTDKLVKGTYYLNAISQNESIGSIKFIK
jgi:hypothetical protein